MKEVTIKFKTDEDGIFPEKELNRALKADNAVFALEEISEELFAPLHNHGYSDERLNELIEKSGTIEMGTYGPNSNIAEEIIDILEEKFYRILERNDIELGDF